MKFWCCIIVSFWGAIQGISQDSLFQNIADSGIIISDVIVTGNKKTKTHIITREMVLHKGDTVLVKDLAAKILLTKQLIFNTTLFVSVDVIAAPSGDKSLTLIVDVKERWYLFPLPYFKLIDRNFNEWWVNQKGSLERVDYGIKFFHNNLSGRNDKLTINLISGYNRQVNLRYERPFIDKKLTKGFNFGVAYNRQKEMNYGTDSLNRQQFYKVNNGFARTIFRADASYSYRPDQYWRHNLIVSYSSESIDDTILKINPKYYPDNLNSIWNVNASYVAQYIKFDFIPYPTKGFAAQVRITKRGLLGQNPMWIFQMGLTKAIKPTKKSYLRGEFAGIAKTPTNSIFINQGLFGFGDFVLRGQELFVIDGISGALAKITAGYELLSFKLKTPLKNPAYKNIPFKFYGKIFTDWGYAHNPFNQTLFGNKIMKTWGIGLDILSIYDFVFKIEYSFNQIGGRNFNFGTGN